MSDYVPRAGSKAEAAIVALTQTKWMSAADLAAEIEVDRANLDGNIAVAVREGVIRRVARDGQAGFALGSTGQAVEPDDDGEAAKRIRNSGKKAKKPARPKRAAPARATAEPPLNNHPVSAGHAVGILECGTVVIVDTLGHAMSLSPGIARRVAELVTRTA